MSETNLPSNSIGTIPNRKLRSPRQPRNSRPSDIRNTPLIVNNHIITRKYTDNLPKNFSFGVRAKSLRKGGVLSEVLFWQQVHKRKFWNIDFDRQTVIGNYIVDFYVKSLSLIIEIDGSSHDGKELYDAKRQRYLESLGLTIFRIKDGRVKQLLGKVMNELTEFIVENYGEGVDINPQEQQTSIVKNNHIEPSLTIEKHTQTNKLSKTVYGNNKLQPPRHSSSTADTPPTEGNLNPRI